MIFPSGQSPSGNIITSCNISPNPPRSRSINDKCNIPAYIHIFTCSEFLSTSLIITNEWSSEADKNVNKKILSPHQQIIQLFCRGSLEGAIKTISRRTHARFNFAHLVHIRAALNSGKKFSVFVLFGLFNRTINN
jgi:hypothetical protein